jgi:predicted amidohydrolase
MQPAQNFAKAAEFVRSAASQGAQLAVLPEYHLTNWKPHEPEFLELAKEWKTYLGWYTDLAKEVGICIVPGTIVEWHEELGGGEGERLLNVAYFIDGTGEVIGKYVKKNLWYVMLSFLLLRGTLSTHVISHLSMWRN